MRGTPMCCLVAASLMACGAPAESRATVGTSTAASAPGAGASILAGRWHLSPLAPEVETQLTHECHVFLSAVHYSDPQLTFDEDEMLFSADSIGGWRASAEQRFPFRRDGDHITIDVDTFEAPPSVLIPCGALPSELSIAPGGERLLENVAFCQPCSHEAAIDGIVGITWVRTP